MRRLLHKKRSTLISILFVTLLQMAVLGVWGITNESYAAPRFEYKGSFYSTNSTVAKELDKWFKKWKENNVYPWRGTAVTPNEFNRYGEAQCLAYARDIMRAVAGGNKWKKKVLNTSLNKKDFVKALKGCKAGTHIRVRANDGGQHSISLLKVTDNEMYWTDDNGFGTLKIRYCHTTIDSFISEYTQGKMHGHKYSKVWYAEIPSYTEGCSHTWNNKGVCTNCKKEYKGCDKLDTSCKTAIASRVYRLKSKTNAFYWPDSSKSARIASNLPKGRFIYVYGKVNEKTGSYYKIAASGFSGIGYIPVNAAETYNKSSSPSKVVVTASDFTMKTGGTSALLDTKVSSNNPIKSISAQIRGRKNLSVEATWDDSLWVGADLTSAKNKVNVALNQLKGLPEGTYNLTVTAKDIFGASGTDTAIITVGGVTPPDITETPSDEEIRVTVTNKHAGGQTYYSINNGEYQEVKNNAATITVSDLGETMITAYTTKDNNKSSEKTTMVFLLQLEQPLIQIDQQGDKGQITITAPDSKADIWCKVGSEKYREYKGPFLVDNGVTVSAYAKKAGAVRSEISTEETEYTEPSAPELKLTNPEATVAAGKTVTIGWQKDWKAETYKATLYRETEEGEDAVVSTVDTDKPSATFTLEEEGTYYVVVIASNSIGDSEPSERLEVSAKAPLTVEFRDAGEVDEESGEEQGNLLTSVKVNYGETAEKVPEPSRKGHSFTGWRNAESGVISTNGYLKTTVRKNTTYYAEYQKNTYKVRFFDPSGKLITTGKVLYGEAADTEDVVAYLKDNGFVTEGKAVTGWSVMKTSEPDSKADISAVDSDMDVQAIVAWEKEDLPVSISIQKVEIEGTTFRPTIRLTTDESKDTDIYLVASLKGTDETKSTDKTLYSDRRVFVIPKGTTGLTLNGDKHDFDLKVADANSANAVTKLEVVALEKKADDSTGSTYSEMATYAIDQESSWTEPSPWSTTKPEEAANRTIESKKQYRYRDLITAYSGKDTLPGYTKGATETVSTTYGAWRISKPATSDNKGDAYREQVTIDQKTAQLGYAWYCDCTQVAWKNDGGSCSKCGTKTRNLLEIYSTKAITNYTLDSSDNSRKLPQTIGKSSPGKLGEIYYMRYKGKEVNSFTSKSTSKAVWMWQYASKKTAPVYRTKTVKTRTKFTKWGDWSAWSDAEYTANANRQVEDQTLYRYSDFIEAPPTVTELEGNVVHMTGTLDVGSDLSGKKATIMVYQTNNNDPNKYQMQYTGQIDIGEGNSYDFSFIPKSEPTSETGNYVVTLGVEGLTGLVTVGVVDAPKEEHQVTLYYLEGSEEKVISTQTVKDGEDADLSKAEIPEKEGWYFIGWSQRTTNITEDCRIRAEYVPLMNSVVFVDWVNQTIDLRTAKTSETIELPGGIEGTAGYTFKGWKSEDGTILDGPVEVTGNMIISAEYEPAKYTVRFLGIDGRVVDSQEVSYGASAEPPAYEPSEGVFVGWNTSNNWWKVEGNTDVLPIVLYTESAMMPTATISEDEETGAKQVEISSDEENADIYYTVDGETPTFEMIAEFEYAAASDDIKYSGNLKKYVNPIVCTDAAAIVAVAYTEGKNESEPCYVYCDPEEDLVEDAQEEYSEWEEVGTYDVKVKPNNDGVVAIDLTENPGLVGYDFRVEMDKGVFYADMNEYDEPVVTAGPASKEGKLSTSHSGDGLRMLWHSVNGSEATGNLFSTTLHVDEEAEEGLYPVTVYYSPVNTLNEEYEPTLLENVNVRIDSAASIKLETLDVKLARTSYEYEGRAIEPAVNIEGLKEGEDYTVEYSDNIAVGTARAVITGIGGYAGTVEKEFTITQANIANADVAEIPDQRATGEAVEPELSVSYGDNALAAGTDYEVAYSNNTEAGTATATLTGMGNFRGTKQVEFRITESLEELLEQALAAKEQAEKDLADATAERDEAQAQAESLQSDLDTANAEIERLQAAIDGDSAEVIEDLNAQLEEANRTKAELEGQLEEANRAKDEAEGRLEEANIAKEEAEQRAEEAERALEEYKQQQSGEGQGEGSGSGSEGSGNNSQTQPGGTTQPAAQSAQQPTEIVDLPAVKITKPKAAKGKITVKWKKVSKKNRKKMQGIQIQVATDPGFTDIVKTVNGSKKKTSKVVKGLQKGTKYYVRIRAYAPGNHVSVWKSKSIKTK